MSICIDSVGLLENVKRKRAQLEVNNIILKKY